MCESFVVRCYWLLEIFYLLVFALSSLNLVMSSHGCGSRPRWREEYFNCRKPQNCKKCCHYQGGTFQGAWKKMKSATPVVVEIFQGVFLCRSTGRGDRFITSSGNVVVHPWGVQDLEVSLLKQWFGLPVWVWPCEACQEPWHFWSRCHLFAKYF